MPMGASSTGLGEFFTGELDIDLRQQFVNTRWLVSAFCVELVMLLVFALFFQRRPDPRRSPRATCAAPIYAAGDTNTPPSPPAAHPHLSESRAAACLLAGCTTRYHGAGSSWSTPPTTSPTRS